MKRVAQAPPFYFLSRKTEPQQLRILIETAYINTGLSEGRENLLGVLRSDKAEQVRSANRRETRPLKQTCQSFRGSAQPDTRLRYPGLIGKRSRTD